jgi:hypothetical protein
MDALKSQSNFVWLRDRQSKDMPGIRPIIYGYDTQLTQSEPVQIIDDLDPLKEHQARELALSPS